MIKNSQQTGNAGELPQFDKEHLKKFLLNIILSGEKLNSLPRRSGARQGCPLLPLLCHIVLEILANTIGQ